MSTLHWLPLSLRVGLGLQKGRKVSCHPDTSVKPRTASMQMCPPVKVSRLDSWEEALALPSPCKVSESTHLTLPVPFIFLKKIVPQNKAPSKTTAGHCSRQMDREQSGQHPTLPPPAPLSLSRGLPVLKALVHQTAFVKSQHASSVSVCRDSSDYWQQ